MGFLDVANPSAVSRAEMEAWVAEGVVNYLGTSDAVHEVIAGMGLYGAAPPTTGKVFPKVCWKRGRWVNRLSLPTMSAAGRTVDDGVNGFLCLPRDTKDLAEKMEKIILMSHQQRLAMGKKSREKIEREFDEQIVIQKYLDAVREVVEGSRERESVIQ